MGIRNLRKDAEQIFRAGLAAVDPERLVRRSLRRKDGKLWVDSLSYDLEDVNCVYVIGAGKGSAAMARGVEKVLGNRIDQGIVVVKHGHSVPLKKIRVVEAGHPIPDKSGLQGTQQILDLLSRAGKDDLVICLLSGGGSALLEDFQGKVNLADCQKATRVLLASGAVISEINAIRKHISKVKGGGLAARTFPASMISLLLSDVIGDDPDVIASGPTVPDATTYADALEIVKRYGLEKKFPSRIMEHLKLGLKGKVQETAKRTNPAFKKTVSKLVGNNRIAVSAAVSLARKFGYRPLVLTTRLQGEAREAAKFLSALAKEVAEHDRPVKKPACLIAAGETTVTIRGPGKGGRNQEMALAAAVEISGWDRIVFLSGGTDGTDGPTDAAGALADGKTRTRAAKKSMNIHSFLEQNNSYGFFEKLGGHVMTGPTLTNVMDLVVILVEK